MPLVWLMLDMDGAGFKISLGFSVKLSCDFFTSEDNVDNSSLMASGPALGSNSAPFKMLTTCSSPIPESVWGMELSSWISSPGVGVSFSFIVSGNAAGVSVMKGNAFNKLSNWKPSNNNKIVSHIRENKTCNKQKVCYLDVQDNWIKTYPYIPVFV